MRGGGCWEERKTVINSLQRELCIQTARGRERKLDAGRKAGSAGRQKKIKIQKTATASEMQLRNTRSAHNGFCTVDICRREEDTEENNYMLKAGFVLNQLLSGKATPRKLPRLLSRLHLGSAVLAVEAICLCWRGAFKWHSTCCHQKDFAVSFLLHQASSREKNSLIASLCSWQLFEKMGFPSLHVNQWYPLLPMEFLKHSSTLKHFSEFNLACHCYKSLNSTNSLYVYSPVDC